MVVGAQVAVTDDTVPAAATVMVVEPVLVESCVEVAVIVTCVLKGTVAAVKRPEAALIVPPPLAVQSTVELKLPVPDTEAVHWLVPKDTMEVGLQLAPTRVIVGVDEPLPPPQAASNKRPHTPAMVPRIRRIRTPSPLLDFVDIDTLWHHGRNICAAMEAACVSTLLKDETGGLDKDWTVTMALLRRHGLFHRLEVGAQ